MTATAYDRLVDVLENVKHTSGNQDQARANCPAHDSVSRSSLSIRRVEGKVLVHCFGGCTTEQILAALGWTKADLYDNRKGNVYSYSDGVSAHRSYDSNGKKKFRQSGNLGSGDPTQLYRLHSIEVAKLAGRAVWLVEGEDDVHALESLGAIATTARGGVGMMGKADLTPLHDAYVCAVVDKDEAGARWAQHMRTMLEGNTLGLVFLQAKIGKDAQDHIAADHGLTDFQLYAFPAEDAPGATNEGAARRIRLTPASSIKPRPVRWAWDDRIPAGEVTLTPGRGGVGKSTFHAWVIAHLTRGTLPGIHLGTPKPCIIAASEDSWDRTIVPRLVAAGADMNLVYRVDVITETDEVVSISLPDDVEGLKDEITRNGVALLSVDPVMSVLSTQLDTHKDRDVRFGLEPLGGLADLTGCVVLGNAHFNKSSGSDPLSLIMGSAAFGNVVRAVLGFARDTEAEDGSCVISQVKNNLGRQDLPSLRYRIDNETIDTEEGPAEVGKLVMLGESDRSVAEILRDHGGGTEERRDAASWIKAYLTAEGGTAQVKDVLDAGTAAGYAAQTLKNARSKVADTDQSGFGKDQVHFWILRRGTTSDTRGTGHQGAVPQVPGAVPQDEEPTEEPEEPRNQNVHPWHSSVHPSDDGIPRCSQLRSETGQACGTQLRTRDSLERGMCTACWGQAESNQERTVSTDHDGEARVPPRATDPNPDLPIDDWFTSQPGRCPDCGHHVATQGHSEACR